MILPCLFIAATPHMGRGVYTSENIEAGTIVEIAPVIVMNRDDRLLIDQTRLHDYIFEWEGTDGNCCMALGYVPIYNHSGHSNCEYEMDYEHSLIRVKAVQPLRRGDELFINYHGDWNNSNPVWFETK